MVHLLGPPRAPRCSKCNSTHVDVVEDNIQICLDCGHEEPFKKADDAQ